MKVYKILGNNFRRKVGTNKLEEFLFKILLTTHTMKKSSISPPKGKGKQMPMLDFLVMKEEPQQSVNNNKTRNFENNVNNNNNYSNIDSDETFVPISRKKRKPVEGMQRNS